MKIMSLSEAVAEAAICIVSKVECKCVPLEDNKYEFWRYDVPK